MKAVKMILMVILTLMFVFTFTFVEYDQGVVTGTLIEAVSSDQFDVEEFRRDCDKGKFTLSGVEYSCSQVLGVGGVLVFSLITTGRTAKEKRFVLTVLPDGVKVTSG